MKRFRKHSHQILVAALCFSSAILVAACANTGHMARFDVVEREAWGWQDNSATLPEHRIEKITIHHGGEKFPDDTNTSYDPTGHALIQVVGDYRYRELSAAQLNAVIQLSAMLVRQNSVPVSDIRGHLDYAPGETVCPGEGIYRYLRDGTIANGVAVAVRDRSYSWSK